MHFMRESLQQSRRLCCRWRCHAADVYVYVVVVVVAVAALP